MSKLVLLIISLVICSCENRPYDSLTISQNSLDILRNHRGSAFSKLNKIYVYESIDLGYSSYKKAKKNNKLIKVINKKKIGEFVEKVTCCMGSLRDYEMPSNPRKYSPGYFLIFQEENGSTLGYWEFRYLKIEGAKELISISPTNGHSRVKDPEMLFEVLTSEKGE